MFGDLIFISRFRVVDFGWIYFVCQLLTQLTNGHKIIVIAIVATNFLVLSALDY
jgi:hypothetical protein